MNGHPAAALTHIENDKYRRIVLHRFRFEILLYGDNLHIGNAHHDDALVRCQMVYLVAVNLHPLCGIVVIPVRCLRLVLGLVSKLDTILISEITRKQIFPLVPLQMGKQIVITIHQEVLGKL